MNQNQLLIILVLLLSLLLPLRIEGSSSTTNNNNNNKNNSNNRNPFAKGCLHQAIEENKVQIEDLPIRLQQQQKRVCNSDDGFEENEFCRVPNKEYPEIRIHNSNWESNIFLSWIYQIVLMEILDVPASVGLTTKLTPKASFYSPDNTLEYSPHPYHWEAMRDARDCHTTEGECIQVMAEIWAGREANVSRYLSEDVVSVTGNGQVGKVSWFLPRFAMLQDPSLISYQGLQGRRNQVKLANAFGRPTAWLDYCLRISQNNCTEPDQFAKSFPPLEDQAKYFVQDHYDGYFEKRVSSCNDNNDTLVWDDPDCTGFIIPPPCHWISYMDSQLYWNNISLTAGGPLMPNGGYSYSSMIEIWNAANATKSPVMIYWWTPDSIIELWAETPSSFQPIAFPVPTESCLMNRVRPSDMCSDDVWVRRGHPEGACDNENHAIQKATATSLRQQTLEQPTGFRSPGYAFIQNFQITDLEISQLLRRWIMIGEDTYGNDGRVAVCEWVVENIDQIFEYLPNEIEVVVDDNLIDKGVLRFGYALVAISWLIALICLTWLIWWRKDPLVRVSQLRFMALICIGAIVSSATVVALSFQAGSGQDTSLATQGCRAAPFLYAIGVSLMYSSILAKALRLYKSLQASEAPAVGEEKKVGIATFWSMLVWVVAALVADLVIVVAFTVTNPLSYQRVETGRALDPDTGVLTIETTGSCKVENEDGPGALAFLLPILGIHVLLIVASARILWKVRHQNHRYQDSKSLFIALIVVGELVIVGVPVLFAVEGHTAAIFLVTAGLICVHDIAILCIIFGPKIKERRSARRKRNRNQRQTDFAFLSMINNPRCSNSKWNDGIGIIDELLDENNDVHEILTPLQIEKLESVQQILFQDIANKFSKNRHLMHIPQSLTQRRRHGEIDASVANNIAEQFGGVNLDETVARRSSMDSARTFSAYEGSFSTTSGDQIADEKLYIPPEFLALSRESQKKIFNILSWDSLARWDFNIFDLLEETNSEHPLLLMGWAVLGSPHSQYSMALRCGLDDVSLEDLNGYHFAQAKSLRIPMIKLVNYLREIEKDYCAENPYHNAIHAADVVQTTHSLLQMSMNGEFTPTKEELFMILLASVVHDVSHPGTNNAFQSNARTDLALIYNDESVLENRHASLAFFKMMGEHCYNARPGNLPQRRPSFINVNKEESNLNLLSRASAKLVNEIRSKVIDAVLHTDMSKHFATVNSLEALLNAKGKENILKENTWLLLTYIMHLADISNPAKPAPMNVIWTDRCLEEFFAQGDKEISLGMPISANCDRKKTKRAASQIGFIKFVVKPAYELLGKILPAIDFEIVPVLTDNEQYWELEKTKEESGEPKEESTPHCSGTKGDP